MAEQQEARVQSRAANDPVLTITEKAPTRAFSCLKEPLARQIERASIESERAYKCFHIQE